MDRHNSMNLLIKIYRLEAEIQKAKASGRFEQALVLFDQLIELKGKLGNRPLLAKSIAEKALLLENMGFYRDALEAYDHADRIIYNSPNTSLKQFIRGKIDNLGNFMH